MMKINLFIFFLPSSGIYVATLLVSKEKLVLNNQIDVTGNPNNEFQRRTYTISVEIGEDG